ncbi:ABC transporter permease [Schaalia sp. ZJ405]|uniref:ABC transporter permease n=1 Tax=Schaalia sp. ZJ405 TaxID=2709403 RepID=UPI0013EE2FA6|nr:ABC transporter permease [Schaalia sp. ZJ405]QPK81292.1 ABC transporter permease [Schaalia sp. ZJ405]
MFSRLFHRRATSMEKYLVIVVIAYIALVGIKNPLFFSLETVFDTVRSGSTMILFGLGLLVVLICGGIDVSFTAIAAAGGYLAVKILLASGIDNILLACAIAGLSGCLMGLVNAVLVHKYKLHALIVTLGTQSVFYGGMALVLGTKSYSAAEMPKSMASFGSANIVSFAADDGSSYGLTVFFPIAVVIGVLTWFILYRWRLGREIFAVGSDADAASRIGINVGLVRGFVYGYAGLLAGITGVIYFSNLRFVNPTGLVGSELFVLAAVVIGGATLTGGEGTILGTILGVTVVQLFQNTLVFLGLSASFNNFFFGTVLLVTLATMYLRKRRANRENLVFGNA